MAAFSTDKWPVGVGDVKNREAYIGSIINGDFKNYSTFFFHSHEITFKYGCCNA